MNKKVDLKNLNMKKMKKIIIQSGFLFLLAIGIPFFENNAQAQSIRVSYHAAQPQISNVNIFPNPVANREMKLAFFVNQPSRIRVDIYDVTGNLVQTPINKMMSSGPDEELIALNNSLPQGLYILSLRNGSEVDAIKFSVVEREIK